MSIKTTFVKIRDNYVRNQVKRAKLPYFGVDEIVRYRILFSGRVQKVGFRLEVSEMAKKLQLTGFCANQEDGSVLVEIQGPDNKIRYLVSFMSSLKRIKIKKKKIKRLELKLEELEFLTL